MKYSLRRSAPPIRLEFSPRGANRLNKRLYSPIKKDVTQFSIIFDSESGLFPNVCLPIAGVLDFYKARGIQFQIATEQKVTGAYTEMTRLWDPYIVEEATPLKLAYPFDRVWKFNSPEGIAKITDAFLDKIRASACVESGVLQGLEWCINETLDNVLQHAESNGIGFIMGQLHKDQNRLAIAVFDYGRGILKSFQDSNYHPCPRSVIDAISLALQERVTRDQKIGQGNGLWGLAQAVQDNGGRLQVSSGGQGLCYDNNTHDNRDPFHRVPLENCLTLGAGAGTTLIDFQLDYDKTINVARFLGENRANLWLEDHEDATGNLTFSVSKECDGTGTRQAAERFRNMIVNAYTEQPCHITIDFSDIHFVSSSFADELIGKLVVLFGFLNFSETFKLQNIDKSCKTIINRSVFQRLAHEYYEEELPEDEE